MLNGISWKIEVHEDTGYTGVAELHTHGLTKFIMGHAHGETKFARILDAVSCPQQYNHKAELFVVCHVLSAFTRGWINWKLDFKFNWSGIYIVVYKSYS